MCLCFLNEPGSFKKLENKVYCRSKKMVIPLMVHVWPTSYFHFLSVCRQCGFMLGILVVLV